MASPDERPDLSRKRFVSPKMFSDGHLDMLTRYNKKTMTVITDHLIAACARSADLQHDAGALDLLDMAHGSMQRQRQTKNG